MPFCSNCGAKFAKEVNFCPECGFKAKEVKVDITSLPEESIPVSQPKKNAIRASKHISILSTDEIFNGKYRIVKVIGRDNDGITYLSIIDESGEKCSLKLFHQSYFDNVSRLLGSVEQLSTILTISHPNIAKVFEVDQTNRPAYIASEYVEGMSLARAKEAEQFDEATCRVFAKQLVDVAVTLRKKGLSTRSPNFNNVIINEKSRIVVLPSGIIHDIREEREEIFYLGLLLARLFSASPFYETLYTPNKVLEKNFEYMSGITVAVNEMIAKCLNKHPQGRYNALNDLANELKNLKTIKDEDIYISNDIENASLKSPEDLVAPKRRLDVYFWAVTISIIVFIALLLNTNLLDTVFGRGKTTFKFAGFMSEYKDSTEELSPVAKDNYRKIRVPASGPRPRVRYDDFAPKPAVNKVSPFVIIPPSPSALTEPPAGQDLTFKPQRRPVQRKITLPVDQHGMVYIYGDTYAYGTFKKDAKDNVSLNGFYISKTEVTQAEWNKYMKTPKVSLSGENLPVDNITWFEAIQYCNARSEAEGFTPVYKILGAGPAKTVTCNFRANGYRLPTEAEWEYAARAKSTSKYSGSNTPAQVAWYRENAKAHIHLVKTKDANAFGLYDMSGNVAEWCWDWYDSDYPKIMPFINPSGPASGSRKAIRGGSIDDPDGKRLEILTRDKGNPHKAHRFVGFRVVRSR